jgi:hypothetical protein
VFLKLLNGNYFSWQSIGHKKGSLSGRTQTARLPSAYLLPCTGDHVFKRPGRQSGFLVSEMTQTVRHMAPVRVRGVQYWLHFPRQTVVLDQPIRNLRRSRVEPFGD